MKLGKVRTALHCARASGHTGVRLRRVRVARAACGNLQCVRRLAIAPVVCQSDYGMYKP